MLAAVAPLLHTNEVPPPAVKVRPSPSHPSKLGAKIVAAGATSATTVIVA